MKLGFSRQILEKCLDIKFHENPFNGSRVVPFGRTNTQTVRQMDGQTERLKLIVALRNFLRTRQKSSSCWAVRILTVIYKASHSVLYR